MERFIIFVTIGPVEGGWMLEVRFYGGLFWFKIFGNGDVFLDLNLLWGLEVNAFCVDPHRQ